MICITLEYIIILYIYMLIDVILSIDDYSLALDLSKKFSMIKTGE